MAQKAIGTTFPAELQAAGLIGLPFSWDATGDLFFGAMTTGQVAAIEAVYAAHDPTALPAAEILAQKFAAGIAITSTASPALNATYALDAEQQARVANIALYIQVTGHFPGSLSAVTLKTATGSAISIGAAAAFVAISIAIGDCVALLDAAAETLAAGGTPTWPTQSATVA